MNKNLEKIHNWLDAYIVENDISKYTLDLLFSLCEIDTSIKPEITNLQEQEKKSFKLIEQELKKYLNNSHSIKFLPIRKEIYAHEYYTNPKYTDEKNVYESRYNLLAEPIENKEYKWFFNSHIDTVPPFIKPVVIENEILKGRGANDNKGGVVISILLLKLMASWDKLNNDNLKSQIGASFTIDEEIGGNGSLSMIFDTSLNNKSIIILEPTKLVPHPANRGAVWFKIHLKGKNQSLINNLYSFNFFLIRKLFQYSLEIRKEYPHKLFSEKDIQICFGIFNDFGNFPASACSKMEFIIKPNNITISELENKFIAYLKDREDLQKYHPVSENETHIEIKHFNDAEYKVSIFANYGHMGSLTRGADAVVKGAYFVEFIENEHYADFIWNDESLEINIEGGHGFLPSLKMKMLREKLLEKCKDIKREFLDIHDISENDINVEISFDKINNEAYASKEPYTSSLYISSAIKTLNLPSRNTKFTGWQASCDARIYALESPDVTTFGAGALEDSHSPNEYVKIKDIIDAAKALFLAIYQRNLDEEK